MNLKLDSVPDSSSMMWRAVGSVRRRPPEQVVLPELAVEVPKFNFDAKNLSDYRRICDFPESGGVPLPYPQVSAIGLQMYLLTQPQFPLPLLGLVHLRNEIRQVRELSAEETFSVRVGVGEHRQTMRGLEFDIDTRYTDAQGEAVWTATATVLFRRKSAGGARRGGPPAPEAGMGAYHTLDAPADIGRRYGRIAGDNNPIHLYPITAKLFGFPRPIAHGMWSLARCCAILQPALARPAREMSVKFIQPLFLPGRAALRHGELGEGIGFKLINRDGDKVHLTGSLG